MNATATNLTADEIDRLREQAEHGSGPFVDPRLVNQVDRWWRPDLCEWATVVTGVEVRDPLRQRGMPNWALLLLNLAHEAEPEPPDPPQLAARRAQREAEEAERQQKQQAQWEQAARAWDRLKKAMPAPVSVAFNYSRHTYEWYVAGRDHIAIWEDLHVGRLHRASGGALCATKSNSRHHNLDCAEAQRKEQDQGQDHRMPNCGGCLTIADRITGLGVKDTILAVDRRKRS